MEPWAHSFILRLQTIINGNDVLMTYLQENTVFLDRSSGKLSGYRSRLPVSVEELVFIVTGRSCSEGCGFDSHYRLGSFLRFKSRPMMSSPYIATWIRGAASVELETVADSWDFSYLLIRMHNCWTNSRIHHTTVATWARYAMWFTLFKEKGTLIRSVSKPSCRNSGAGPTDTTTGPQWGVYNTRWWLNKYASYITLQKDVE